MQRVLPIYHIVLQFLHGFALFVEEWMVISEDLMDDTAKGPHIELLLLAFFHGTSIKLWSYVTVSAKHADSCMRY
jgi:hypothetical protein